MNGQQLFIIQCTSGDTDPHYTSHLIITHRTHLITHFTSTLTFKHTYIRPDVLSLASQVWP